jgi:4-amino-4-deoxy-L-arabinose transferase-like glycosyltransferase
VFGLAVRLVLVFVSDNNGTDAHARYLISLSLLKDPFRIPSEVWLPFHFWLLAPSLWIWSSELCARLLTALIGAFTLLPFWGIVRRAFDREIAIYSTLLFAVFGFHVAYSATTSSEIPTIFMLVAGVYSWLRYRDEGGGLWFLAGVMALSAASLCRYEAWLYIPVLGFFLLDASQGWKSILGNRPAWLRAFAFTLAASAGAILWMGYSYWRWGDPLWSAHRTLSLNLQSASYLTLQQPLAYRLMVVPGALAITLSPWILILALWGMVKVARQFGQSAFVIGVLAATTMGLNYFNAVYGHVTMARYTLLYSWLLIPPALKALDSCAGPRTWLTKAKTFQIAVLSMVVWQVATTLGAYTAPERIADKLAVVVPGLPPRTEIRELSNWLKAQNPEGKTVIVDQFNYEAVEITRSLSLSESQALVVPANLSQAKVDQALADFVTRAHPRLLIYSPRGLLGNMLKLRDDESAEWPRYQMRLRMLWRGNDYRVYDIEYSGEGKSEEELRGPA